MRNNNYEAWIEWKVTNKCNLSCDYCWSSIGFRKDGKGIYAMVRSCKSYILDKLKKLTIVGISSVPHLVSSKIVSRSPEINISALIKTLDKTNKIFQIGITGGEPFLVPNIIAACVEITRKHCLSLVTNLTSEKIKEFSQRINPERVTSIIASCHIKELERLNLLDRYINNFRLCKEKGFAIYAREVAHPSFLAEVKKYKEFFRKEGIELRFNRIFRGEYNGKTYPASYSKDEIEAFELKTDRAFKGFRSLGKICNAGYNAGYALNNGDIVFCCGVTKSMGNLYERIQFSDNLIKCPRKYCICPFYSFNDHLFEKALNETKGL